MMPLTYVFHGQQFIAIGGAYIHNTWCYYVLYVREGFWAPFSIDAIVHWIELVEWWLSDVQEWSRLCGTPRSVWRQLLDRSTFYPPVSGTREGMSFSKVQTCRPIQRPSNICECSSPLCGGLFFSVQTSKLIFDNSRSWLSVIRLTCTLLLQILVLTVNWSTTTSMKTPIQKTFASASSLSLSVRVDIRLSASGASPLK